MNVNGPTNVNGEIAVVPQVQNQQSRGSARVPSRGGHRLLLALLLYPASPRAYESLRPDWKPGNPRPRPARQAESVTGFQRTSGGHYSGTTTDLCALRPINIKYMTAVPKGNVR